MNPVFISVIIPVYNMSGTVTRCLKSLRAQPFRDLEVILVDDGSTDGTGEDVKQAAAEAQWIHYVRQPHSGVSSARNSGLDLARGEYVVFIDADDVIDEDYLPHIAAKAKSSGADMIVWGIMHCYPDGRAVASNPRLNGFYSRKEFLTAFPSDQYGERKGLFGFATNKAVRKSILDRFRLRFDEGMSLMEDYDFFLGCFAHCESFYCFPETGYHYFHSERGKAKRNCASYRQLINVHSRCAGLLESEDAMTYGNRQLVFQAIANLSISLFLELDKPCYAQIRDCIAFIQDSRYCSAALRSSRTRSERIKEMILSGKTASLSLLLTLRKLYIYAKVKKTRLHGFRR